MARRAALLVTAHPDDECMFFTPLILGLQSQGLAVCLLCLSTGNAEGLGPVRVRELSQACAVLGVPQESVKVVDDPLLPDSMEAAWGEAAVAAHIAAVVRDFRPAMVVTFDGYGVSGHPNHTAAYRGLLQYRSQQQQAPSAPSLQYFVLESSPLVQKYSGVLSALFALVSQLLRPRPGCYINWRPGLAWAAMRAHASQLVWYRRAFIWLSRYSYLNTVRELR